MSQSFLQPPEWQWNKHVTGEAYYVNQWVNQLQEIDSPDLILYGAPLSKSSISVSGASLYPNEFRRMWKGFATYNLDENVDLRSFKVGDAGDVMMHTTDTLLSHQRIKDTATYLMNSFPTTTKCLIGGDHSITACTILGIKQAVGAESIGILQLDSHLDVRDPLVYGPANGTPIRQLIDQHAVKGSDVYNIGLHGYFNSKDLVDYATRNRINIITVKQARKLGVVRMIKKVLQALSERVDRIYVTVDMDVLDITEAPGVPASTPGGLSKYELFDSLLEIGRHHLVKHIDFVCLDPSKDTLVSETVKIGVYAWLQFITGRVLSINNYKK